jgi:hypothetical protein
MKQLVIVPDGWPCTLAECRPGFFVSKESLCLKSEYGTNDAYVESGEYFAGGAATKEERALLIVQPVKAVWEEVEVE